MSRLKPLRFCAGCTLAALACGSPAAAQVVQLVNRARFDPGVRDRVEEVLGAGRYRVWTRDTVLAAGDTVDGDVFVFRATARISGVVTGQLVAVESEVFVRPGAEIRGGAVVLNGGYYGTQMAEVGPVLYFHIASYRVRGDGDEEPVYRIIPPRPEAGLSLVGVSGFLLPSYERVSAVTIPWGLEYRPGLRAWAPYGWGTLRFRTARGRLDGELGLRWEWSRWGLTLEGGRRTETQDGWISGEFENSLAALFFESDRRNYYETKFARGSLDFSHGRSTSWRHRASVLWEDASSLANEDPFAVFGRAAAFRANPPIDDGRTVGLRLESSVRASWRRSSLTVSAFWEVADAEVAGDLTYARAGAEALWEGATFRDHILRVRARGGGPLGGEVPRQRWIALGGYRTLPTLRVLELRGDTYLFVQSTYFVPAFSAGLLDVVGWVQHGLGSAWTGRQPSLEQTVGVGFDVGPFSVWLFADPSADDLDLTPGFGLRQL